MAKSKVKNKETPLMKQYNAIKAKHPNALLLFRVGDFYETFGEDAIKASKILDIVLTKRSNGAASSVELAGFPHHAIDNYLTKLVRAGERVAICDQLEDPKSVKGIVKRGITELVTPGVSFNDQVLEVKKNNYLASVYFGKSNIGISFLDISTGEYMLAEGDTAYIDQLLQGFSPAEVLFCKQQQKEFQTHFGGEKLQTYRLEDWAYTEEYGHEKLLKHFNAASLKGFGVESYASGIVAAGAILAYLEMTEHHEVKHISGISRIAADEYVWLDKFTIRSLELIHPQQEGGVPLIDILDHCLTPMGARLLRKWVLMPLKSIPKIEERLGAVGFLVEHRDQAEAFEQRLQQIGDLERLISKVAVGRINPREMVSLKKALSHIAPIKKTLMQSEQPNIQKLGDLLDPCELLLEKIEATLQDHPPLQSNQGNLIKEGIDPELDEVRGLAFSGKDYLVKIQRREMEATGIPSLKIAYNKVFGYYLEVTNAHKNKVPETWIRKQTLVNAERYITEELKVYEEKILNAEEKMVGIEQRLFLELIQFTTDYVAAVQQNAMVLARLDCLCSFAQLAQRQQYVCPQLDESKVIDIEAGRHPVIEQQLGAGDAYVPNDVYLDDETQQLLVITGPNMSGKSALLRQTALITLLAQMGSFVPASQARIGLVDKVFTRVGASDNLSKGESTFMVEMTETASILNNLSDRSLVLMDEIGRGTSTYDGISIAWAIVEFLHSQGRAKTLFATHYHELNQLADDFPRIRNFNVAVKEMGKRVIFLRKLQEGGSAHSFGIHVAQMAGMPNPVVIRAAEILKHLEKEKVQEAAEERMQAVPKANYQLSLFDAADPRFEKVKEMLGQLDINTLSPVEALLKLNELKGLMAED